MSSSSASAAAEDPADGFGRGMLLLAIANGVYIVTAYAVTTITARVLEPEDFGRFGVAMAWVSLLSALLVKGLSTSTAREMAAGRVDPATAWRAGARLGLVLSLLLAGVGVALSPIVAPLLGADGSSRELALASLGALTFGVNAVLLAWPIGMRRYGRQALAQAAYALSRVLLVVGGAIAYGLVGAVAGYVLAPLLSSLSVIGRRPAARGDGAAARRHLTRAIVPISLVTTAVSAFFIVDVFALSAIVGADSDQVGVYVAYGTVAHVPFFLLQAASVAAVPAIAAASSRLERRTVVQRTVTDVVVLLAGPTMLLAVAGDAAARIMFGSDYRVDGGLVAPLAVATAGVTLLASIVSVDVAVGRMRMSLAVCGVGIASLAAASAWAAEHAAGSAGAAAIGVAWAAAAVSVATAAVLGLDVRRRLGGLAEPRRAAIGLGVAVLVTAPVAAVSLDELRVGCAAAAGIVWVGAVLRFGLVDVRRRANTVDRDLA